jgi:hypothetical protein
MMNFKAFVIITMGVILILIPFILFAQSFEETNLAFPGTGRGDLSWCDYDNDHDLDVLITGRGAGNQRITVLYRNDEGSFTESEASFAPVEESMACWGDYDLDGDQDLLLAGNAEEGDITRIYRNDEGSFTEIDAGLPGIQQGIVLWIDIEGDDDLDIFISGSWITRIYLNENGIFTHSGQDFGYFSGSSASFGDYDNDGDADLLISGDSGAGAVTRVFSNEEGNFADSGLEFPGLMAGTTDWVDYDLDGDLDIAVSGNDDALEAKFYLYKNQNKDFELVYSGISGFALGDSDWGDYDNDGDPDLLMSGKATGCGATVSGIYRNDGNDVFTGIPQEITTATRCALNWTDFDNDGDFDFLIAGMNAAETPFAKLYRNVSGTNDFTSNTPPDEPSGLSAVTDGSEAAFSWLPASDSQTPAAGLTYNFRLGTSPGGNEIVSPMAILSDGYRIVYSHGNAGQNTDIAICNLDAGTYYWSVQAIDQAMEGSVFSEEQSFTITSTGIGDNSNPTGDFLVYPNPARDHVFIQVEENYITGEVLISDLSGKVLFRGIITKSLMNINLDNLKSGTYLLRVKTGKIDSRVLIIKL